MPSFEPFSKLPGGTGTNGAPAGLYIERMNGAQEGIRATDWIDL